MQNLDIELIDNQLHIKDFPDSVRVIKVGSQLGRQLSHLALHVDDLEFALECLREIDKSTSLVGREALWRNAVFSYAKCFGSSVRRRQLAFEKVFKGASKEAKLAHAFFKELRNRHFAHDENAYAQAIPAAIVNREGCEQKIAKVVCLGMFAMTLDQGNGVNLRLLIEQALLWARTEFDALAEQITAELEKRPHNELLTAPIVQYTAPSADEVGGTRQE